MKGRGAGPESTAVQRPRNTAGVVRLNLDDRGAPRIRPRRQMPANYLEIPAAPLLGSTTTWRTGTPKRDRTRSTTLRLSQRERASGCGAITSSSAGERLVLGGCP